MFLRWPQSVARLDAAEKMTYSSDMSNPSQPTPFGNVPRTRGARRRMQTRAKLLAAARQVFAAHGYQDVSVADITEAADVGVGTFYLHFGDKDAVFHTLIEEGLQSIRQQVLAEIAAEDAPSLPLAIQAIFRQCYAERELLRIALSGEGLRGQRRSVPERMAQEFQPFLLTAQAQGILDDSYEVALLAQFLAGMIVQGIIWWFDHHEPGPAVMADQLLRLLARGLPPPLLAGWELW